MTTSTSSKTYASITSGDLSFTNIMGAETDIFSATGDVTSLITDSGNPSAFTLGSEIGIAWSGVTMTTSYSGAPTSQTVTFTYDVSSGPTDAISSIDSNYNALATDGGTFTATMTIKSTTGTVLAIQTYTYGQAAPAPVALSQDVQNAVVTLTLTETANTSGAFVTASVIDQLFGETPFTPPPPTISIDKQISINGGATWIEVGATLSNPSLFDGLTVEERVVVVNTGSVNLTNVAVTDAIVAGGEPPINFGVVNGTGSLAAGATWTSSPVTVTVIEGLQEDTATATAVGNGTTVAATDTADFSGVTLGITLDKQISVNGSIWVDVGDGNVSQNPTVAAGTTLYERVIVVNDGNVALNTGSVVADVGSGPSGGFVLPAASLTAGSIIAAGDTIISNVGTFVASSGTECDTATVTGTDTDTAGQTETVSASDTVGYTGTVTTPATCAIGDYVWFDCNSDGLIDSGETGVAGVTVDLLNAAGTSVLAVTTTNASGHYEFTGLAAGTYEVKFVAPTGDAFTKEGATQTATDSSANQKTGITAPITLTAGQTDNNVEAGLVGTASIVVNKVPGSLVVNDCGQETYTFDVTNTGSEPITNLVLKDNIGTAANPDYITPTPVLSGNDNVGDTNHDGVLSPGETWVYTVTTNPIQDTPACNGSINTTCSGSDLGAGNTAWFSCSFTPTSTKNGTTYVFKDIDCQLSGGRSGGYDVNCPDAIVTFSSSCTQATTVFNSSENCWITTLPANGNPGNVFLTGCPVQVPAGCDFSNANACWTIGDSSNNCGSSSVSWQASCQGYSAFDCDGDNGCSDYNQIGVKVCDTGTGYGNGGCINTGYGYDNGGYCAPGNSWGYNSSGYQGSSSDCAGTPENQFTSSNCGSSGFGDGYGGYGGSGYGGGSDTGGCGNGGSGSCTQTQTPGATGVADTVTVTGSAEQMCGRGTTTVTASDTAEVMVLGSQSDVTVGGTAPTGSLSSLYGKAQTLEFSYTPGNSVTVGTAGIGAALGGNANAMAFIVITNNANPTASGAQVYFEGTVATGQDLYADASINALTNTPNTGTAAFMSQVAGASIYADVFTSQAAFLAGQAAVQADSYNASSSQAMHLGDTVGSLSLVGYVGASGGHLVNGT